MENTNTSQNTAKRQDESRNTSKKDQDNLFEFLKDFKENGLKPDANNPESYDEAYKTKFLDELLGWKYKEKIEKFKNWKDKYNDLDLNKISIEDMREKFQEDLRNFQISRNDTIKLTMNEFKITEAEAEKEIKNLIEDKLNKLKENDKKGKQARKKHFEELWFQRNIKFNNEELKWITDTSIKQAIQKIKNDGNILKKNKEEFFKTLRLLDNRNKTEPLNNQDIICIQEMLEANILSEEFWQKLIKNYLPFISIWEAKKAWFLKESAEIQKLVVEVENRLKIKFHSMDEVDKILVDLEKVVIPSKDNFKGIFKYFSIDIAQNLAKDYNLEFDDIKDKIEGEVRDFVNLKIKLGELESNETKLKNSEESREKRLLNLNKFTNWCIIEIDANWVKNYVKVVSANDAEKSLKLETIWQWENINLNKVNADKWTTISYNAFYKSLRDSKNSIYTFYSEADIQNKVVLWDLKASNLHLFTIEDIKNDEVNRAEFQDRYKEILDEKIREINNIKTWKSKEEQDKIDERVRELEEKRDRNLTDEELIDQLNLLSLIAKLDELDEEWKLFGLEKGMFLEGGRDDENNLLPESLFEIMWISDWKISLRPVNNWIYWKIEEIDYVTFYESFKQNKTKRIKAVWDFKNLFDEMKWDWYKYENWKIQAEKEEKWYKWTDVEYLVSDDDSKMIKIESISWDKVIIQEWERHNRTSEFTRDYDKKHGTKHALYDKKGNIVDRSQDNKIEADSDVFYLWDSYEITTTELKRKIENTKWKLHPDVKIWKKQEPEKNDSQVWWGLSWFFSNWYNIWDIIWGPKKIYKTIEEYFKKWQDIRSAKFALAMWRFLPLELRSELQTKMEMEENESMEKFLKELEVVESSIATERIEKWLKNSNTPEYKKEAWLMFMVEKYWVLTNKTLWEYNWKFLWYEAFWWKVWDKLYMWVKHDCEKSWIQFSEEYLMYVLLLKQCKWWYNWIKRRWKLYKGYDSKWANWIKADYEKWKEDATKRRLAQDRLEWWMNELLLWAVPCAIWWFEEVIDKWGKLEVMTEWFFCLIYSWVLYDTDQKVTKHFENMWKSRGMPHVIPMFATTATDMKFFNQVVLQTCKEMERIEPIKYKDIWKEAQDLYNDALNNRKSTSWPERVKAVRAFWKKFWKPLSRTLHKTDNFDWWSLGNIAETKNTNKIADTSDNPIFKKYNEELQGRIEANNFHEDYIKDCLWHSWVWWLNTKKMITMYLAQNSTWWTNWKMANKVWKWISSDIEEMWKLWRQYKDNNVEYERCKKYIVNKLENVISGFSRQLWDQRIFDRLQKEWFVAESMNKWWIKLINFWTNENLDLSKKIILKKDDDGKIEEWNTTIQQELEKAAENILNGTDMSNKRDFSLLNPENIIRWKTTEILKMNKRDNHDEDED